jgi:hypothetical protein
MPRPVRPWFRFYVEAFSDRKLRRLSPTQRWIWMAILGAARDSPEPGKLMIAADCAMTNAELAGFADVREREIAPALVLMSQLGMVLIENDAITVRNWGARQYESDNVTERTRNHRERSKERSKDVPGNVHRNTPETETETETEKTLLPHKRGTRIPKDWKPSTEDVAWQRESGISDLLARRELPKFCDYWVAKTRDATKLDWSATWRNWLRTAVEREPKTSTRTEGGGW